MKKFYLLLTFILLLSLSIIGVGSASSAPEVVTKTPSDNLYYDLNSPTITCKSADYVTVLDKIDDDYYLLTYTDTLLSKIKVGSSPIDSMCVYGDYAILCTSLDGTILVYDVTSGAAVNISDLPSSVYHISLSGSTLYVQTSTVSAYSLTEITDSKITLIESFDSSDLFKVQYGIYADEDVIYYTKKSVNTSTIYAYDTTLDTSNMVIEVTNLVDFVVNNNVIYTLTSDTNKLSCYDINTKTSYDVNLVHQSPSDLFVYQNEIIITHTSLHTIDVYDITTTPTYKLSLCSDSELVGRFNTPIDVHNYNSNYAVADYMNDRIQVFDNNSVIKVIDVDNPTSVALNEFLVVTNNNTIYTYDNYYAATSYTDAEGIAFSGLTDLCIDANGTIYAIDTNNRRVVKKSIDDSAFNTFLASAPMSITIAPHGTVIYAVYSNAIYAYDSTGKEIFSTTNVPNLNKANACMDATGSMFIIDNTKLYTLKRTLTTFTLLSSDTIDVPQDSSCKISVSRDGELLMVDGVRHQIFEIKNTIASSYSPNPPDDGVYEKVNIIEPVGFVHVANDTFIYQDKNNYETTRIVRGDTTLMLLSNIEIDGFYYVYHNGPAYLPVNRATVKQIDNVEYDALSLHNNTSLYKYPILEDEFKLVVVNKDATFKVVTNVADFSYKGAYWCQIEYNDNIYYVTRNNVGLAPTERVEDHGIAKLRSSIVGQKIKVYSLSDDKSGIIGEYNDGTEVKLLAEIDNASTFTKIQIDDQIGYVKTKELTTGGMTTAQVVILILILLGGTASVTILVISRKMYKRR